MEAKLIRQADKEKQNLMRLKENNENKKINAKK